MSNALDNFGQDHSVVGQQSAVPCLVLNFSLILCHKYLQGPEAKNAAQTVYTVRMSTGSTKGSGLSELNAGVWLCLVGQNGDSFLHRAVPLCDSEVIEQELYQICQVPP